MTTSEEKSILEQIRRDPYFSLRLIPASDREMLSAETAKKLVHDSKVSLRGWDFPHVDLRRVHMGDRYLYTTVEFGRHLELWRFYLSGQFVYLGNLWDAMDEFQPRLRQELDRDIFEATAEEKASVRGLTSFIGLIYSVTEFYLLAARLSQALGLQTIQIENRLHGVEGWALAAGDQNLIWHSFFQCKIAEVNLDRTLDVQELVANPMTPAVSSIKRLFEAFNWLDASPQMIRQWQEKLMSGRFAF